MKIIINGRFLTQKITGVQRVAFEILKELDKISADSEFCLVAPLGTVFPAFKNIKCYCVGKKRGVLWEQTDFYKHVKKEKAISLNLCNSAPLFGKKIVMVHDVKFKAHPEYFSKKFRLWYNILFKNITKKALKILTVSEFSKNEILKYYKKTACDIEVLYNGWQHFSSGSYDSSLRENLNLKNGDYCFAMSSLEPNKNIKWIVETAKFNKDETFIIAGGINAKIFAKEKFDLPKNVKLVGYVNDGQAKDLIKNCKAFIFPTFYEGFGIPPLEAMAEGVKKVIVSDTEVMHEVYKDSVVYINPQKYDYLISDLISKETSGAEDVLNSYSWERSAAKLKDILCEVK